MRFPKVQYLIAAAVLAALGYLAENINWHWGLQSTAASLRYDLDKIDPIDGLVRMYHGEAYGRPTPECVPRDQITTLPDPMAEEWAFRQRTNTCHDTCRSLGRCVPTGYSGETWEQRQDCNRCYDECVRPPREPTPPRPPICELGTASSPGVISSILNMGGNFFSFLLPSLSWTGYVIWLGSLLLAGVAVTGAFMRRQHGWGTRAIEQSPLAFIFWIVVGAPLLAVGIVFVLKWLLIGLVSLLGATAGLIVWAFAAFKIASILFGIYSTARDLENYAEGSK